MENTIQTRGKQVLGLDLFSNANQPETVCKYELKCPYDNQYILRMLVKLPHEDFKLPEELEWLRPLIMKSKAYQEDLMGIRHPFCYVTVRHGLVKSQTDDEWHVDGFSTAITHLPEQNYIISDSYPTEYVEKTFPFPNDFDPLKHNVHLFFQDNITQEDVKTCESNVMYCMDPYIPHRRVDIPDDVIRTFVRISYTPIEILDDANTPNPLIPMRKYDRDGVIIRNKLVRYENVSK